MNWYINRTADIANGDRAASRTASIMPLAYPGDGNAHVWRVTVTDSGSPASLTGAVPIGYFMRGYDGETVMQTGTISGNVISVTIPAEAYAYSGHVTAIIRINHGGANMTIDAIAYEIGPNVAGDIIDPGEVIPGIDDLIAQIERMEADTAAAEAAVAQVNDKLAAFDVAIETFYPHSGGVGNIVTVEGTVDAPPAELIIYGKSVQNGAPTPSAPAAIMTAGSGGTLPMVSTGADMDDDPERLTSAIPTELYGLPGIPVMIGGNYTDTDGQDWLCDTIDLEAGTWTKRCGVVTLNDSRTYILGSSGAFYTQIDELIRATDYRSEMLCDRLTVVEYNGTVPGTVNSISGYRNDPTVYQGQNWIYFNVENISTLADLTTWLGTHPIKVVYVLATPVVTQLTAAQIAALRALRGRKGLTNLYSADPAGPEIRAEMYIDIPTYIQSLLSTMDRGFDVTATNNGLEFTSIE